MLRTRRLVRGSTCSRRLLSAQAISHRLPSPYSIHMTLRRNVVALFVTGSIRDNADSPPRSPAPLVLDGNSVAVIDPTTNSVVDEIAVGGRPSTIALGGGSAWVGNRDDDTLLRIDEHTRRVVHTIGLGVDPAHVLFAAGAVWIGLPENVVLRVDPQFDEVAATIPLPGGRDAPCGPQQLVGGPAYVWILHCGARPARRPSLPERPRRHRPRPQRCRRAAAQRSPRRDRGRGRRAHGTPVLAPDEHPARLRRRRLRRRAEPAQADGAGGRRPRRRPHPRQGGAVPRLHLVAEGGPRPAPDREHRDARLLGRRRRRLLPPRYD